MTRIPSVRALLRAGLLLWILAIAGLGLWVWRTPSLVPDPPAIAATALGARTALTREPPATPPTDSLVERAIRRTPFRLERRPAGAAYDPATALLLGGAPPPPKPTPPRLALTGLVLGEAPAAVVEGLPGTEGPRVMQRGEVVSGVRVLRIQSDRVVVRWSDTTWTVPLRTTWP
ncbi:MAG TPA: hypothetical protein VFS40_12620 [Gemmatimonadales bacterium]|nr:hypothetical protein [Gemmatimonadales bacterium]